MLKHFAAVVLALAVVNAPAIAQSACEPAKLAAAVDTYALDPFSARTWRVLKGLADPMIEPATHGGDYWVNQESWRKLAAGIAPEGKYLQQFGYDCRISYPLETLNKRIAVFGSQSKYVKQWLRVQDSVLQACSEPSVGELVLPAAMDIHPELARMQSEDRAYQEASIAFYRDKAKAIELFRAIADSDSSHQGAARYNVANLLANGKQLAEARAEAQAILADPALANVHVITKELLGYIANLEDTTEAWTALIEESIRILETPAVKIAASAQRQTEYAHALYDIDYAGIRGKSDDWWLDGKLPENPTISKAIVDASRNHAIALWMMAGQSMEEAYRAAPWSLIGGKWQARMSSYIDRALAIAPAGASLSGEARAMLEAQKAMPDQAGRKALWDAAQSAMAAAEGSCGEAPATAAAGYLLAHATRLSALAGDLEQAYSGLEKVPFKGAQAYYERSVLKLGEYLLGEGNLAEARRYRARLLTPAFFAAIPENMRGGLSDRFAELLGWIAEDEAHWKAALAKSSRKTSNLMLNFLPSRTLWAYAGDTMFSVAQRGLVARAAWTRDFARGLTPSQAETEKLMALNPGLKTTADKVAADYPKTGPERRRLLTMLRSPRYGILISSPDLWDGMERDRADFNEIDSYDANDKNWWCPFEIDRQLMGLRNQFDAADGLAWFDDYWSRRLTAVIDPAERDGVKAAREAVLKQHPEIRAVDWQELAALAKAASGPRNLSEAAIRWGKASRGDDGAPEALALAVRSTRYGCRWHGGHGSYSRAAQQLLQRRFKGTVWAAETPYWFDCMWRDPDKPQAKGAACAPRTWPLQPLPE
ncbi:MAG: hypothetical protein ACT4SY_05755 [Hyphomicrobiales bacterium]